MSLVFIKQKHEFILQFRPIILPFYIHFLVALLRFILNPLLINVRNIGTPTLFRLQGLD